MLKFEAAQTVWDSLAICETLAERHPEAQLWPEDARSARAGPAPMPAEMHSGFPDVRDQLTMDFAPHPADAGTAPETRDQIARIITAWEDALAATAARPVSCSEHFHRRLHVCAGGVALYHL